MSLVSIEFLIEGAISGNLVNKDKSFNWEIKKKI